MTPEQKRQLIDSLPENVRVAMHAQMSTVTRLIGEAEHRIGETITHALNEVVLVPPKDSTVRPPELRVLREDILTLKDSTTGLDCRLMAVERAAGLRLEGAGGESFSAAETATEGYCMPAGRKDISGRARQAVMLRLIRPMLEKTGLSVEQLAALLGVQRASVYRWLNQSSMPRAGVGIRLQKWLKQAQAADESQVESWHQQALQCMCAVRIDRGSAPGAPRPSDSPKAPTACAFTQANVEDADVEDELAAAPITAARNSMEKTQ